MPDPVPVMIIPVLTMARLAVDQEFHRSGLGQGLLRDAMLPTLQAADIADIRAIRVHAISSDAQRFYERASCDRRSIP